MSHILLDTHTWAWSLSARGRLSARAILALQTAESISLSTISFYEIGQKVRIGKWPEMASGATNMVDLARAQGAHLLDVSAEISVTASSIEWSHRDPFDRFIAATAIAHGLQLISADGVFDDLEQHANWPGRLW